MFYLFIAVILAFPLLFAVRLVKTAHVWVTRRELRKPWARIWGDAVGLLACLGCLTFLVGFGSTFALDVAEACVRAENGGTSEGAPHTKDDFDGVDESLFPVSYRCVWRDGTTHERVPGFVNPTLYTFMAGTAVTTTLALASAVHARTGRAGSSRRTET
ncbi:hypothetical protein [Streptomyces sp. URMC 123]|uniref:hypothetical protein n=1 Tax=Streptomyces sp. URMC 123 TaxID=3423403 RepID=UPI003F1A942C